MMAVIHLVEYDLMFSLCPFGYPPSKDIGNPLSGDPGQTQIAQAFQD